MEANRDGFIDIVALGLAIKRKREELNLSLREVADEARVSASTLSRIENGTGRPDAETIGRLSDWLNLPIERLLKRTHSEDNTIVIRTNESTPDIIEAYLRADPNLSPETATAMAEMLRVAYNQFGKKD